MIGSIGSVAACALTLVLAASSTGLTVDTDTPEALCPDLAQARAAIAARVGEIEGSGHWHARYTIVHRPANASGDAVRLVLEDPGGAVRLERLIPMAGQSCATMAETLAVVLEGYFRDGAGSAPLPPDDDLARSPVAVTPASSVVLAATPTTGAAESRAPAVDLGFLLGATGEGTAAGGIAAAIGGANWRASLMLVASPTARREPVPGSSEGSASSRSLEIRLPVLLESERSRWRVGAGPELALVVERATTTGLAAPAASWRGAPGAGVAGVISYRVSGAVAVAVDLHGDVTPPSWTRHFAVAGAQDEVLAPRSFRGFAAAALIILWGP